MTTFGTPRTVIPFLLVALLPVCGPIPPASVAPASGGSGTTVSWGMVIHGGAGTIVRAGMGPEREALYRASLEEALRAGYAVLAAGGSALDAVTATVIVLEDDSLFNAGRGAVFTSDERHELDAAIMDGPTRRAGAVTGVTSVRNPILLARAVMEGSEHVFLAGPGADAFALAHGLELVPQSYFRTEAAWQALQRSRGTAAIGEVLDAAPVGTREAPPGGAESSSPPDRFGTVGAVALDRAGRLASATSTGGMTNKLPGRVGDVPVIGAGTYANSHCAISGTGWGEFFIRNTVARDVCAHLELGSLSLQNAADRVVRELLPLQANNTGGVIGMSAEGEIVWSFNTAGMFRGRVDSSGAMVVEMFGAPASP